MVITNHQRQTWAFTLTNLKQDEKSWWKSENSNFWGMWPLGHVGHVTYSFINMLFISRGIFDDKLRSQILSVGPFILLVEETERPRENHRPVASHWQTLSHNVVHLALIEIRNNWTCSFKSNYHTIMAKMTWENKTSRHDISEILLKVALNTIKQTTTTSMLR
jgi:hypothetical protein